MSTRTQNRCTGERSLNSVSACDTATSYGRTTAAKSVADRAGTQHASSESGVALRTWLTGHERARCWPSRRPHRAPVGRRSLGRRPNVPLTSLSHSCGRLPSATRDARIRGKLWSEGRGTGPLSLGAEFDSELRVLRDDSSSSRGESPGNERRGFSIAWPKQERHDADLLGVSFRFGCFTYWCRPPAVRRAAAATARRAAGAPARAAATSSSGRIATRRRARAAPGSPWRRGGCPRRVPSRGS